MEQVAEPQVQHDNDVDFYLHELDKANKRLDEVFHFIEMTEALTYDKATSERIAIFLKQQGIWKA